MWDLELSVLRPILRESLGGGASFNCVSFHATQPVIAIGTGDGRVKLLRLSTPATAKDVKEADRDAQALNLEEVIMRDVMRARARRGMTGTMSER